MKLEELATALGLPFEGEPSFQIRGLASLDDGGPSDLGFVTGAGYRELFQRSAIGVVIVPLDFDVEGRKCLRSIQPYADFARAVDQIMPDRHRPSPGVHPTAVLENDVELGADVSIGAYAVLGSGCMIGARSIIHPHVTLYPDVRIGEDCVIHSHACLREAVHLGNRIHVQNGAVIGSDGFGFAFRADGTQVRVPHRRGVEIGDEAEIGSNTTIDRSHPGHSRHGFEVTATRIGRAVKIDNQVHIAHDCVIEDGCTLCGQTALGGGTYVEKNVFFGGRSGAIRARVGEGSLIGGWTGVLQDTPPGSKLLGFPAIERGLWGRVTAALKRLPELLRRVRRIEKALEMDQSEQE